MPKNRKKSFQFFNYLTEFLQPNDASQHDSKRPSRKTANR